MEVRKVDSKKELSSIVLALIGMLLIYIGATVKTLSILAWIGGLLVGVSIISYYKDSKKEKVFKRPLTFVIFVLILTAFIVLTLFRFEFMGNFYYYLSTISVIFTFLFVSLVIVFLIPFFAQKSGKLFSRYIILPVLLALALTAAEIFIAYKLHQFMAFIAL